MVTRCEISRMREPECRALFVEARPGNPTLWCHHPSGCRTAPESALPGPPLGGFRMRDTRDLRGEGDERPAATGYDPSAARQQQLLRSLGAVLWDIAGNRKSSHEEAAGFEPAADEGGL